MLMATTDTAEADHVCHRAQYRDDGDQTDDECPSVDRHPVHLTAYCRTVAWRCGQQLAYAA